jgi:tetratricopeptide (TPR) repeat protein
MLVGEPGIGKTRTAEEFCDAARAEGAAVLWGRCFEGEWAPPYGPFVEAIAGYGRAADPDALRADLGPGAGALARLAPSIREWLPDIPEPAQLQPDEERYRLLDAVAQFLIAASARAPVVLVLDDLHWADKGTIAMLRHVARFAPRERILLLGAYRDVELDRQHPLADALAALRREVEYERILLRGLQSDEVGRLLTMIAEHDVPQALVDAISRETEGNPFFIRETLLHLVETGALYRREGRWTSDAASIEELGIPEGVRQVIGRRLSRLSEQANRLLTAASGFSGDFSFEIARRVAALEETVALDAVDEALEHQLLRAAGDTDRYLFTHALVRHTLYGEMNPSRQVRLHRQIAEAMEEAYASRAADHAAELAYQYHHSAALPGAEHGVGHAIAAADHAQAAYAHDETVTFLRIALELLPADDPGRSRLLGRFAVALAWTVSFDESVAAAMEAAIAIAAAEGEQPAAEFLAEATQQLWGAGSIQSAWRLAEVGRRYAKRRDATWARLVFWDVQRREAANPQAAGSNMPLDTPEYDEFVEVTRKLPPTERPTFFNSSREEVLRAAENAPDDPWFAAFPLGWQAGEFRRARELFLRAAGESEGAGRIALAVGAYAMISRCHNALGDLDAADAAYEQSMALSAKLGGDPLLGAQSVPAQQLVAALDERRQARGTQVEESAELARSLLMQGQPEIQWARSSIDAAAARILAVAGHREEALAALEVLSRRLDRIPAWDANNVRVLCDAAHALWALERTDHLDVIERNLREKVIAPDFRYPMYDGRLSLAQLCALTERYDEAVAWFARARAVLEEQGARPLRAIVDYDEALMYQRHGDRERAAPLWEAALRQFREIGMTGWERRAEELRRT